MIIYVTKHQIKKSISTEPLTNDYYGAPPSEAAVKRILKKLNIKPESYETPSTVAMKNATLAQVDRKDCATCAVGTVIFGVLNPKLATMNLLNEAASVAARDGDGGGFSWGVLSEEDDREIFKGLAEKLVANNWQKQDDKTYGRAAKSSLLEGRFMHALEYVFENRIPKRAKMSDKRRKLLKFIDRFFPTWVLVDVNGTTPEQVRTRKSIRFENPYAVKPTLPEATTEPVTGSVENAEPVKATEAAEEKPMVVETAKPVADEPSTKDRHGCPGGC